ncbi:MAG TPA: FG-GAP repeat protein [Kofleriaceae bacterium]|nr:FG-GAP repeat protein [Kofleriaceae bacterium]
MRRALVCALVLAGCRQALGIPEQGSVEQFTIGGEIRGAVGITDGPARLFVEGDELAITADGPFTFERARDDGTEYTVTADHCTAANNVGMIAGADVTDIALTCDGLVSLRSFGFSAPLEESGGFASGTLDHQVHGSLLAQQMTIAPAFNYDGGRIVRIQAGGATLSPNADGSYGPLDLPASTMIFTVENANEPTIRSREYTVQLMVDPPAIYGYGKLDAPAANDTLGRALAADGDVLVAGLPDRAVVFRRAGTSWTQEALLLPPDAAIGFGAAVAIAGDRIVVGAPGSGSAYEFTRTADTWTFTTKYQAPSPTAGDEFGAALAISGDALAVGAPGTAAGRGAAYVIDGSGTRTLTVALEAGDRFGTAIAIAGTHVVVGAPGDDSSDDTKNNAYADAGAAYVFDGAVASYLKPASPGAGDAFGSAVAIDATGTRIVVGAPLEDGSQPGIDAPSDEAAPAAGAAYTFTFSAAAWSREHVIKPPAVATGDNFGAAVAIAGTVLAIGAPYRNDTVLDAGAAYVYSLKTALTTATTPELVHANNPGESDAFGSALALTRETLVVGAPREDSPATGWNGNQGDGAIDTGAVYSFR